MNNPLRGRKDAQDISNLPNFYRLVPIFNLFALLYFKLLLNLFISSYSYPISSFLDNVRNFTQTDHIIVTISLKQHVSLLESKGRIKFLFFIFAWRFGIDSGFYDYAS